MEDGGFEGGGVRVHQWSRGCADESEREGGREAEV